jgi:GT2 family glycosyltransferase
MTAVVIPTLGAATLRAACAGLLAQRTPPARIVVVASGPDAGGLEPSGWELIRHRGRLGFADAVNLGLEQVLDEHDRVAVLNDDALPAPAWLDALTAGLGADDRLAAVQGTVSDVTEQLVDGRGITLDSWWLPVQVDHGQPLQPDPPAARHLLATSATAVLYRSTALREARLPGGSAVFDPRFGSYHEDLDLGLRLQRLGWRSAWIPGAHCRHLGSATGRRLSWRHPWWLLVNRWRALAGNLTLRVLAASLPRLLRGELRAVATLCRHNPRALAVACAACCAVPAIAAHALSRQTPGPRLAAIGGP